MSGAMMSDAQRLRARGIQERFPGTVVWYGPCTGRWWACLPDGWQSRLLEADTPGVLSGRIADVYARAR